MTLPERRKVIELHAQKPEKPVDGDAYFSGRYRNEFMVFSGGTWHKMVGHTLEDFAGATVHYPYIPLYQTGDLPPTAAGEVKDGEEI